MKLSKVYQPQKTEDKILKFWGRGRFTEVQIIKNKKPFVITLPPPNVTGNLHAGHAMYVIEDIAARRQRMIGTPTLWLPGFDHASIAVEYLVTKQLKKEGKSKQDIGRKEFLRRAKNFAAKSKQEIKNQLKKLGFSLDWSKEAYTMDNIRSKAVEVAFLNLYRKNLIYQGEYIVNWCPSCKTAISDLENIRQEEDGKLYYLKYGPVTIATSRPETMFADVAVAIHSSNKKYKHLIGSFVPLPLTNRKIPVIKDDLVDPKFGTGALKITPAHDELDFQIGKRHNLNALMGIDYGGRLTEIAGKYAGLTTDQARQKVVNDLQVGGFIEKIEEIKHSVGRCERCDTKIEPLISKQWFLKTKLLAQKAIKIVEAAKIKIIPKRFEKIYFHWLKNIKDWCISRQLWWGHRLPIWQCQTGKKSKIKKNPSGCLRQQKSKINGGYFVSLEKPKKCSICQKCKPKQIEDTLDTWFSSALWPISVFGWPKETKDYKYFYPTTLRETGYDILFFWVAREIMMCLEMTGKIPFKIVYLHGLVRDEQGRKFSKTKGIGFDPLDMTAKYGTDALRMALVVGNAPGNDLKIGEEKIRAYRNFANKIWNASRFILMNIKGYKPDIKAKLTEKDKKTLEKLNKFVKEINKLMKEFKFYRAAEKLYHYFWHTFADKIIEENKKRLRNGNKTERQAAQYLLLYILKTNLALLHPFMPFITEEIYQKLPDPLPVKSQEKFKMAKKKKALIIEKWPL